MSVPHEMGPLLREHQQLNLMICARTDLLAQGLVDSFVDFFYLSHSAPSKQPAASHHASGHRTHQSQAASGMSQCSAPATRKDALESILMSCNACRRLLVR